MLPLVAGDPGIGCSFPGRSGRRFLAAIRWWILKIADGRCEENLNRQSYRESCTQREISGDGPVGAGNIPPKQKCPFQPGTGTSAGMIVKGGSFSGRAYGRMEEEEFFSCPIRFLVLVGCISIFCGSNPAFLTASFSAFRSVWSEARTTLASPVL